MMHIRQDYFNERTGSVYLTFYDDNDYVIELDFYGQLEDTTLKLWKCGHFGADVTGFTYITFSKTSIKFRDYLKVLIEDNYEKTGNIATLLPFAGCHDVKLIYLLSDEEYLAIMIGGGIIL